MRLRDLGKMIADHWHRESIYSTPGYWDAKAGSLQGSSVSMWHNVSLNALYDEEVKGVVRLYIPELTGRRILDVGCGTGRVSRFFASQGAIVLGVDFSARALEIATSCSPGDNPSYRHQSMFELQEGPVWDVVFTWGSIAIACKNRDELGRVMRNLYGALVPGGRALLLEPIHRGFLHRVLNMKVREFIQVMEECGFQVEDWRHMHFWPCRCVLAYVSWPPWVTKCAYHCGDWIMGLTGRKRFGDYVAVYATSRRAGRPHQ